MWKRLARRRLACRASGRGPVAAAEIEAAESVLFAVFARYGDSVIAFKLIREFARRYPAKRYRLVTTPQALPYAQAIIGADWPMIGIDKRRHWFRVARLLQALRRDPPALGLNPWSHGVESEYLISHAQRYFPYRDFAHFTRADNLYMRIRRYLQLPDPPVSRTAALPARAQRIVVAPFSTDVRKSLNHDDLRKLVGWLKAHYGEASIAAALFPEEDEKVGDLPIARFHFGKSRRRSRAFLELVKGSDLFVGVDAGPLHLADALGIPAIGIFGPTAPETILDRDSGIVPLRLNAMQGWFCDIRDCADALCLHRLLDSVLLPPTPVDFARPATLEVEVCRAKF